MCGNVLGHEGQQELNTLCLSQEVDQTLTAGKLHVNWSEEKVFQLFYLPNNVQELFKESASWNKLVNILSN